MKTKPKFDTDFEYDNWEFQKRQEEILQGYIDTGNKKEEVTEGDITI